MALKYCFTITLSVLILSGFNGNSQQLDERGNSAIDTMHAQTNKKANNKSNPSVIIGGTYSFGGSLEDGPAGTIIIYPLRKKSALFFLDICLGAPSYRLGQLFGQMTINDNEGVYDSKTYNDYFNCILKFKFSSTELEVTTESDHEDCGFGYSVYADNKYELIDKSIPKYFIDGHGDTTFFEGLTVEKYYPTYLKNRNGN